VLPLATPRCHAGRADFWILEQLPVALIAVTSTNQMTLPLAWPPSRLAPDPVAAADGRHRDEPGAHDGDLLPAQRYFIRSVAATGLAGT